MTADISGFPSPEVNPNVRLTDVIDQKFDNPQADVRDSLRPYFQSVGLLVPNIVFNKCPDAVSIIAERPKPNDRANKDGVRMQRGRSDMALSRDLGRIARTTEEVIRSGTGREEEMTEVLARGVLLDQEVVADLKKWLMNAPVVTKPIA